MIQINSTFQIKVIIEKSSDGFYWAYSDDVHALTAGGSTIEEVKQSIFSCIEILKELCNFPFKNYEIVFIEPVK